MNWNAKTVAMIWLFHVVMRSLNIHNTETGPFKGFDYLFSSHGREISH